MIRYRPATVIGMPTSSALQPPSPPTSAPIAIMDIPRATTNQPIPADAVAPYRLCPLVGETVGLGPNWRIGLPPAEKPSAFDVAVTRPAPGLPRPWSQAGTRPPAQVPPPVSYYEARTHKYGNRVLRHSALQSGEQSHRRINRGDICDCGGARIRTTLPPIPLCGRDSSLDLVDERDEHNSY
jgi:hypothetical protein